MRSSNKSRSRNKNQNRRGNNNSGGNVMNRVFDSSGPEGKVRGTPQQIIDKYQALASDAQLAGDRIGHENFLQHAEHYARLLGQAQREMNERREAQEAQRQQNQQNNNQNNQPNSEKDGFSGDQPDVPSASGDDVFPTEANDSNLVETPENAPKPKRTRRPAKPKIESPAELAQAAGTSSD